MTRVGAGAPAAAAIAEIDYDRYALGESLLGWLNAEVRIGAADAAGTAISSATRARNGAKPRRKACIAAEYATGTVI